MPSRSVLLRNPTRRLVVALVASIFVLFALTTSAASGRASATPLPWSIPTPYTNTSPYYEVATTGAVWSINGAKSRGSVDAATYRTSVVGATLTPGGGGYWLLTATGRVFNRGNAHFYGSPWDDHAHITAAGLVPTPDGKGYWVYTNGGRLYAYGDARNQGGLPGGSRSHPIVGMAATPDGQGYWLVASNGQVWAYGDARNEGGELHRKLAGPIVGVTGTGGDDGYLLLGANGSVYNRGSARWYGSAARAHLGQPAAELIPTSDGHGYWLVAHDGDLHGYGDAYRKAPPTLALLLPLQTKGDHAVAWAMRQLGKPYVYGGTGPNGFDCSGLTMKSWLDAGVDLPREAASQYDAGHHVSIHDLVAGDLVFWASDPSDPSTIYHVGMYLGAGHMVVAPAPGQKVMVQWVGGQGFMSTGTAP